MKLFSQFQHTFPYICLISLWLIIVLTNYIPGTWLIGWDNLLPELNFSVNVARTLSPVWQESQGFGLLGGIAHASEITRQLLLWLASLVLPKDTLRYAWTFGMLLLGAIGTYHLALSVIKAQFQTKVEATIPALTAALYYLLNPATVQNFYVPLEAFSSFYGFLPWLLLLSFEYLQTFSVKTLRNFFLLLILASSAFHVQTMFIVFCMVLSVFLIELVVKKKKAVALPVTILLVTLFCATAFWFLPVGYFAASGVDNTILSKQNQLATTESYLLNQGFGDFTNIVFHKGYWLEYTDIINNKTVYLMQALRDHLAQPLVAVTQTLLAIMAITGLILSASKKKALFRWSFVIITLLTWGMLSAGTGILGLLFTAITQGLPLFYQMFRVTFTKWSIMYGLLASLGIGFFVFYFGELTKKYHLKFKTSILAVIIFILSTITVWPIFKGQLIYDQVQLRIPEAYFELFDFFDQQPAAERIMVLPAHSFWDWRFHSWGYRGSGFLWYGIKQPLVDRNFDVWSMTNETFYAQLSQALNDHDTESIAQLINQYDINYILLDESVTIPNGNQSILQYSETEQLMKELRFKEVWQHDFLHVYQVSDQQSFLSTPNSYFLAEGESTMTSTNPISQNLDDYVTTVSDNQHMIFPLSWLTREQIDQFTVINDTLRYKYQLPDNQPYTLRFPTLKSGQSYNFPVTITYSPHQLELDFIPLVRIENGIDNYEFQSLGKQIIPLDNSYQQIYLEVNNQILILDQNKPRTIFLHLVTNTEIPIIIADAKAAQFSETGIGLTTNQVERGYITRSAWKALLQSQTVEVGKKDPNLEIVLPTVGTEIALDNSVPQQSQACDVLKRGEGSVEKGLGTITFKASNRGAICYGWLLDQVPTSDFQLLQIKGDNSVGRPMKVFIEHLGKHQIVREFLTPEGEYEAVYSLPAWSDVEISSYALNIEARSLGGENTQNKVSSIVQYQVPLGSDLLSSVSLYQTGNIPSKITNAVEIINQQQFGTYQYLATVESSSDGTLVLNQAFDPGWIAFRTLENNYFPTNLLNHESFNGWANAWIIPQGNWKITIFYLPQLLHFLGIIVGLIASYFLIFKQSLVSRLLAAFSSSVFSSRIDMKIILKKVRNRLLGKG
ncbi:MAG: hypothetical protein COY81_02010 [Candidatus Pacebacteria bacterium CG_4_10_14_0_8_um_filter_43_12]|nr:MAG: hypothetical protein COU66_02255 [Candidatus Pacebacteria bacterium CG10_big_fil_rev_8_21_14_0_10_44_11]PIY79522.1 MAG: hypothetical protein COY81_02010 [Candidatus Pacebacteria bacterium CG_4_10_14_0_8_um_filter_43_12]